MSEQRIHTRSPLRCKFKIWNDNMDGLVVWTRDVSDGGVFLLFDPQDQEVPPVGTILKGQIQGMVHDAPVVTLEVVRIAAEGIGLRFIPGVK